MARQNGHTARRARALTPAASEHVVHNRAPPDTPARRREINRAAATRRKRDHRGEVGIPTRPRQFKPHRDRNTNHEGDGRGNRGGTTNPGVGANQVPMANSRLGNGTGSTFHNPFGSKAPTGAPIRIVNIPVPDKENAEMQAAREKADEMDIEKSKEKPKPKAVRALRKAVVRPPKRGESPLNFLVTNPRLRAVLAGRKVREVKKPKDLQLRLGARGNVLS